jgi:hypothetical protein
MTRQYTNQLLEMIEEGILDKDTVISAFCSYMSEADVQDLCEREGFIEEEEEDAPTMSMIGLSKHLKN